MIITSLLAVLSFTLSSNKEIVNASKKPHRNIIPIIDNNIKVNKFMCLNNSL